MKQRSKSMGAVLLTKWLRQQPIGAAAARRALASALKVVEMTVFKWEWGTFAPSDAKKREIETHTGASVRATDWLVDAPADADRDGGSAAA